MYEMPAQPREDFLEKCVLAYPDVYWVEGCEKAELKNFEIDLKQAPGAIPKAAQPFNLSEYDQLRVDYFVTSERGVYARKEGDVRPRTP